MTTLPPSRSKSWAGQSTIGAGNETRTRDPDLGKVVLYQLSYSRVLIEARNCMNMGLQVKEFTR